MRITEIAFDGQSFKAPEVPKKEPKVKKAAAAEREHESSSEVKSAKGHDEGACKEESCSEESGEEIRSQEKEVRRSRKSRTES